MPRRLTLLLLALGLTAPGLASAEELTPEQIARIQRDEKAAVERVNAAHGNKKPSELSNAERRQMIQEQQDALQGVMEKHGVSRKDYARQTARMGPKQNAAVEAAAKELEAKEKVAESAKSGAAPGQESGEIRIQQGFSDENPVTMEEEKDAPLTVEHGLPPEEQDAPEGEK